MNSGGPQHVCFYSKKCRWCEGFINELKNTPYFNEFKFICVDPSPQRPPLPGWLKKVPTIVIRGEKEPRTDGDVMNWLSERRLMGSAMPAQPISSSGNRGGSDQRGSGAPPAQQEVEPWIPGEMGGAITKSFSFINSDESPKHNFEFLNGGGGGVGVRTASDMPGGGLGARGQQQKSKKEELFDKQMENFMRQRTAGMPPPVHRQ